LSRTRANWAERQPRAASESSKVRFVLFVPRLNSTNCTLGDSGGTAGRLRWSQGARPARGTLTLAPWASAGRLRWSRGTAGRLRWCPSACSSLHSSTPSLDSVTRASSCDPRPASACRPTKASRGPYPPPTDQRKRPAAGVTGVRNLQRKRPAVGAGRARSSVTVPPRIIGPTKPSRHRWGGQQYRGARESYSVIS